MSTVDKIPETCTKDPSKIPHKDEAIYDPQIGSIVNESDLIGYDSQGELVVIRSSVIDQAHAHYCSQAMDLEVSGYLDYGSIDTEMKNESLTGEELHQLARNHLNPGKLVKQEEGYGVIQKVE